MNTEEHNTASPKERSRLPFWLPYAAIIACAVIIAGWIEFGPDLTTFGKQDADATSSADTPNTRAVIVKKSLSRQTLMASFKLGRDNILCRQLPNGRFTYEFNFITEKVIDGDNPVRQAGTLWGLTLCHQYDPTRASAVAIEKGFAYFAQFTHPAQRGGRMIVYPKTFTGATGTIALLCLAHIEYIRTLPEGALRARYEEALLGYFEFLMTLRLDNGLFAKDYRPTDGVPILRAGAKNTSPYYDGEAMLAMIKAAKYLEGYEHFKEKVAWSAEFAHTRYVVTAQQTEADSPMTKGFFQWGAMTFFELYDPSDPETDKYADWAIDLGYWMIDTHKVLTRKRNTAYAYEGILMARELARLRGNAEAMKKFDNAIRNGFATLTRWQVGGPFAEENPFLRNHPTRNPLAVGGIMNAEADPVLRIDVTQHQLHATTLAMRYIWR